MVISNYSTIRLLHSNDPVEVSFDPSFDLENFLSNENKHNFDIQIKNLIEDDKNNIDLVLLLRCKVSHCIYYEIKSLHSSLSTLTESWTFTEILSWHLDDDGRRFIRKKRNLLERLRRSDRVDYNYFGIEKIINEFEELKKNYKENRKKSLNDKAIKEIPRILPFSVKVIYTFNTEKNTKISTWVKQLIKTDNYLKKQLIPYSRVIFNNKFTLLIKTSDEDIINAWQKFGKLKDYDIDSLKQKLKEFRKKYNKETKRKYVPDKILEDLALANSLNKNKVPQYINKNYTGDQKKVFEDNSKDKFYDHNQKSEKGLDYFLIKWSNKKAKNTLKKFIEKDMKKWSKDPGRKDAWVYFSKINLNSPYKNNEYSKIASKCKSRKGFPQKVSWLCKVHRFEEVAREVWEYMEFKLKNITINYLEDPEEFIMNFKEEEEGLSIASSSLKVIKEKFFLGKDNNSWGGFQYKTIFDNPKEINDFELYNDIHNSIFRYINPKKSRKKLLIKLVNEILKEKGIIENNDSL